MDKNEQDIERLRAGRGEFNFKGLLVTQIAGGWMLWGTKHSTPESVLNAIKVAEGNLENSITIPNNGNFASTIAGNIGINQDIQEGGTMYPNGHIWEI
jgi:hypothetical protein